jgi:hypothetical protein
VDAPFRPRRPWLKDAPPEEEAVIRKILEHLNLWEDP